MLDFFAYLMCLCGRKCYFLIKTPIFGVHFGVHILIPFFSYDKSPSSVPLEELFFFMNLKFKLHQIHLIYHESIREMGINTPNKPFRTVPHPSIYNIRSYVLHTGRRKGMAQEILCYFLVLHHSLEYTIQGI